MGGTIFRVQKGTKLSKHLYVCHFFAFERFRMRMDRVCDSQAIRLPKMRSIIMRHSS